MSFGWGFSIHESICEGLIEGMISTQIRITTFNGAGCVGGERTWDLCLGIATKNTKQRLKRTCPGFPFHKPSLGSTQNKTKPKTWPRSNDSWARAQIQSSGTPAGN